MKAIPFKVIATEKQYFEYCDILYGLTSMKTRSQNVEDAIELLTVLVEKYDDEHSTLGKGDTDPVGILKFLMKDHQMKAVDLAKELNVSKSLISDVLHYKKGFSKVMIQKLAKRFCMRQEAFNRPYPLKVTSGTKGRTTKTTRLKGKDLKGKKRTATKA